MDRRRFIPRPEGLEGRALLSSNIFGSTGTTNAQRTIENMPDTWTEKTDRVAHLGFYLQQVDPQSPLPSAALKSVQDALTPIIGQLHAANTDVIESFNLTLRKAYPHKSLNVTDANQLNNTFGNVLLSAGATPQQTTALQLGMTELAKGASNSTLPVELVSNEYAITLQVGLGIGKPIHIPVSTRLAAHNGTELINGKAGSTPLPDPRFVGTYLAGNRYAIGTTIQVIDSNGIVHSVAKTDSNGNYETTPTTPFPVGTYKLFTRAVDPAGHMSQLSLPYELRVYPRRGAERVAAEGLTPPAGPLGLK